MTRLAETMGSVTREEAAAPGWTKGFSIYMDRIAERIFEGYPQIKRVVFFYLEDYGMTPDAKDGDAVYWIDESGNESDDEEWNEYTPHWGARSRK